MLLDSSIYSCAGEKTSSPASAKNVNVESLNKLLFAQFSERTWINVYCTYCLPVYWKTMIT